MIQVISKSTAPLQLDDLVIEIRHVPSKSPEMYGDWTILLKVGSHATHMTDARSFRDAWKIAKDYLAQDFQWYFLFLWNDIHWLFNKVSSHWTPTHSKTLSVEERQRLHIIGILWDLLERSNALKSYVEDLRGKRFGD